MGVEVPSNPINRKEQYLAKIAGQAVEIPAEPITREEAYLDEIAKNGSGGGGGTTNYNLLSNKPQIAGTELQGNKSLADLGIASEEDLAGKQNALTAGLYIEFDGNEISVKRDITQTAQEIAYNFTIPGDYTLRVKKYMNGDLVDTTDYNFNSVVDPINLDSIMEVSKKAGGGFYWVVKNLIASTTQAADYSVELYALQQTTNYTQTFVTTIDADKKLIIQSELDAAINAIKDGQNIDSFADVETALGEKADTDIVASDFSTAVSYTAGNYCIYDGKFYKFKTSHSGTWAAADVDEIKIAGELSSLKSGLTGLGYSNILQAAPLYLAGSTDLNTITSVGVYGGNLYPSNLGHSPEPDNANASYVKLLVSQTGSSSTNSLEQQITIINDVSGANNTYKRQFLNNTWSDWTSYDKDIASLKSGLTNAAKAVYRDYHQIAASGNYTFTPTLEVNHAYLVTICAGNNVAWGYCGIMLKGWVSYSPVLSDIYKGTYVTVTMVDTDSIQVSNTDNQYNSDIEIVVTDLGKGYIG